MPLAVIVALLILLIFGNPTVSLLVIFNLSFQVPLISYLFLPVLHLGFNFDQLVYLRTGHLPTLIPFL